MVRFGCWTGDRNLETTDHTPQHGSDFIPHAVRRCSAQRQRQGEGHMSSSKVVSADAKDEFWAVVEDCLREFHGMKQEGIRRKAGKLRKAIERMMTGEREYFDHSEPFDCAC